MFSFCPKTPGDSYKKCNLPKGEPKALIHRDYPLKRALCSTCGGHIVSHWCDFNHKFSTFARSLIFEGMVIQHQ